ncbi:MAG: hypothetical protein AUJ72_03495 [Candidatus Omnitrophica bacterium CG1_02_46_14]|nr:MAG: hypothetical protein AUJ72_03495 [Candidatus Omnitrophica bacterium CG1_02_46_14]
MADPLKNISKVVEDKLKLWLALVNKFISERNPREKQMVIALGLIGALFFDYWILIHPVVKTYLRVAAESAPLETEYKNLKDDQKNEKFIKKNWEQAKLDLELLERRFIAPNETPAFLENISKLALNSGVKVMSLQPLDNPNKNSKKKEQTGSPYTPILIRMSAIGGTHEFGKFLSALENNQTFIRVMTMKMSPNSADDRRHSLDLDIEVYRREASA